MQQDPNQQGPAFSTQPQTTPLPAMNQTTTPAPEPAIRLVFEEDLIVSISKDQIDDMRFLELYETVSENNAKLPSLLRQLMGDKKFEEIYQYYESRGDKFRITKMIEVFTQLESGLEANPGFLS